MRPQPLLQQGSRGTPGGGRLPWLSVLTWNKRELRGGSISAHLREVHAQLCAHFPRAEGTPAEVGIGLGHTASRSPDPEVTLG